MGSNMSFEAKNSEWILKQLRVPRPVRKALPGIPGDGISQGSPSGQLMEQPQPQPGASTRTGGDQSPKMTNYVRIQQRPVEDFKDGQFKTVEFGEGIKAVYGHVGASGKNNPGKWAIQTLLFPKGVYTIDSASQWARNHGFKVGVGGLQPGNKMPQAGIGMGLGGQVQSLQPQQPQQRQDMPAYSGGPAPVQAQGTKGYKPDAERWAPNEPYAYNQLSGEWVPTEKSVKIDLEKGLEVAIGGISGTPGIFCDWCRVGIGSYKKYGDFRLCGKCYESTGRLRFEK